MPNNESRSGSLLCSPPTMSGNTSNNSSNCSSNNNNNNDVPEDMFKYYIEKCYVLPLELKNDIIYCQRAMRDFLKVHALVSDVFKEQPDADPVQMQRILDELETEVYEINAEQQYLLLRLNDDLDIFYKKLEENNIQTVPELGNDYISSLIVPLIGDASYKISPQSVLCRDNEEMLIRKHFLISQDEDAGVEPLKLSELDDNVPLMLINPIATATITGITGTTNSESLTKLQQEQQADSLNNSGGSLIMLSSPSPPPLSLSPVLSKREQQRSLLIPRGILSDEEQLMQPQLSLQLQSQPPPLAAVNQRVQRLEVKQQQQPLLLQQQLPQPINRCSTSPPPLAPITHMTLTTDFEEVAQSRMNLRQALRRARKTKQQPRQFDDEDVMELPTEKAAIEQRHQHQPPQLSSLSIKPGKASKVMDSVGAAVVAASLAKKAAPTVSSKQYKTRNAFGAGRKMSTPPPTTAASQQQQQRAAAGASSGSSGSSDDSHQELELEQQRLFASAAQWRDEPRETRVQPSEYGQEHFLRLFGLYTHDMVKKLCQRHSKRKRRTVQNASGVDFHYGQQLTAIDPVRQKKLKDKPEFLLSPKEKRLQAKKAHKASAVAAAAAANRKSKSKTPEKLEGPLANSQPESTKQKCKECKKRGENLLLCQGCQGYFHPNCREDTKIKPQSPFQSLAHQSNSRCPQCERDWTSANRTKYIS